MQDNNTNAIVKGLRIFQQAQQAHAQGKRAEAAQGYRQALTLMPDHPTVLAEYARLADEVEDWNAAEKLYRRIGELRPKSNFEGHVGHALFRLERYADAIAFLEIHVERNPQDADVVHALGNSLCAVGRWHDGLARLREAARKKPDDKRIAAVMTALFHLGEIAELETMAEDAIARFPDSRDVRSMYSLHKMKAGDYAAGYRYFSDFRWRNNQQVPENVGLDVAAWDGKPFAGTLLVIAEQGLGDEIMMSSMLDSLLAVHTDTVVECDARLLPVFRRSFPEHRFPQLRFVPRHAGALHDAVAAGDRQGFRRVNAQDLGIFFRNAPEKFPAGRRSWLQADPERTAALRDAARRRWPGRKLVGISWKSTRIMEGGEDKSFRLDDFRPLLERDDCAFISLQYGNVAADIAAANAGGERLHVAPEIDVTNDIDGLCAQIAGLDAVVSTSNTTVHIAGALGVPCLVLLPKIRPVLWYWGYAGERTPWYPALQLMRNDSESERAALLRRAVQALPALWRDGAPA